MIAIPEATFSLGKEVFPPSLVTTGLVVLAISDAEMRARVKTSLLSFRWQVAEANTGAEALGMVEALNPEALILDTIFSDLDAEEVASYVEFLRPDLDVVRLHLSANPGRRKGPRHHELLLAVREAQQGNDEPCSALLRHPQPGCQGIPTANRTSAQSAENATGFLQELIGLSEPMRELAGLIQLVAPRKTSVLIEGETGTGKEVVAQALHRLSKRANQPFVVLNCAAIPATLLEAELFGHTRGAFTGATQSRVGRIEAADGGTLFLDEIGEMPLELQAKMLRFLECGELQRIGDNQLLRVDVRVIAATHQPLEEQAAQNKFRLDLYHRLAVFPIEVPSLRDRLEDIDLLATHFLTRHSTEGHNAHFSEEALAALHTHAWPGNVRELMHVVERAVILSQDARLITEEHIRLRRKPRFAM